MLTTLTGLKMPDHETYERFRTDFSCGCTVEAHLAILHCPGCNEPRVHTELLAKDNVRYLQPIYYRDPTVDMYGTRRQHADAICAIVGEEVAPFLLGVDDPSDIAEAPVEHLFMVHDSLLRVGQLGSDALTHWLVRDVDGEAPMDLMHAGHYDKVWRMAREISP
jgi:hypothetical protein